MSKKSPLPLPLLTLSMNHSSMKWLDMTDNVASTVRLQLLQPVPQSSTHTEAIKMVEYNFASSFCWLAPLTRSSVVQVPTGKPVRVIISLLPSESAHCVENVAGIQNQESEQEDFLLFQPKCTHTMKNKPNKYLHSKKEGKKWITLCTWTTEWTGRKNGSQQARDCWKGK